MQGETETGDKEQRCWTDLHVRERTGDEEDNGGKAKDEERLVTKEKEILRGGKVQGGDHERQCKPEKGESQEAREQETGNFGSKETQLETEDNGRGLTEEVWYLESGDITKEIRDSEETRESFEDQGQKDEEERESNEVEAEISKTGGGGTINREDDRKYENKQRERKDEERMLKLFNDIEEKKGDQEENNK